MTTDNGSTMIAEPARKLPDPIRTETPYLPSSEFAVTPEMSVRALVHAFRNIFIASDIAWREDRTLQRQMRNDPDIANPLEQRVLAVTTLNWDVFPEDADDPEQCAEAAAIKKVIERTPRLPQLFRNLALGVFYGHSAVNLRWSALDEPLEVVGRTRDGAEGKTRVSFVPCDWLPLHPDSIVFDFNGDIGVKINRAKWKGDQSRIASTEDSSALMLSPVERESTVLSQFSIEAADFDVYSEANLPYAGRGLRSRLWHYWYLKQTITQYAIRYMERLGRGIIIGRYPAGNKEARRTIIEILKNVENDSFIPMPVGAGETKEQWGVEFDEPTGSGWEVFKQMIVDYLADAMHKVILGQTLTSTSEATGLGSGVAKAHESTLHRIIKSDARTLNDAITGQLVPTIQRANFPGSKGRPRFEFVVEDIDNDKFMDQVERFIRIGGAVDADSVRSRLGLRAPEDDSMTLGGGGQPDPSNPDDEGGFGKAIGEGDEE